MRLSHHATGHRMADDYGPPPVLPTFAYALFPPIVIIAGMPTDYLTATCRCKGRCVTRNQAFTEFRVKEEGKACDARTTSNGYNSARRKPVRPPAHPFVRPPRLDRRLTLPRATLAEQSAAEAPVSRVLGVTEGGLQNSAARLCCGPRPPDLPLPHREVHGVSRLVVEADLYTHIIYFNNNTHIIIDKRYSTYRDA